MLAHELCNPLAPILTGLELMQMKLTSVGGLDPMVLRSRDTVERQVRHLIRLVDDLLDISRITSGKIELRRGKVVLAELVEQAVVVRAAAARTAPAPARGEAAGRAGDAACGRGAPDAGARRTCSPTPRATPSRAAASSLRCERAESAVEIRVTDNGRGIAPELLPRIFEPFVQEHGVDAGGLGLGLALVKRLIEMHDGTVAAHSDGPGRGSEFIVTLPLEGSATESGGRSASGRATPESSRSCSSRARSRSWWSRTTTTCATRCCLLLTMLGHTVDAANTGERGRRPHPREAARGRVPRHRPARYRRLRGRAPRARAAADRADRI